jgi:expansin (peptidoglycan-binding protein)
MIDILLLLNGAYCVKRKAKKTKKPVVSSTKLQSSAVLAQLPASSIESARPSSTIANGAASSKISSSSSKVTYYGDDYMKAKGDLPPIGPKNGGWYGACYDLSGIPKNWNKFAALNAIQYYELGSKTVCGTCVQLNYKGNSTRVQIVDMCPGCPRGGIDISHAAFADLVGSYDRATQLGVLQDATWEQVDCSLIATDPVYRGPSYVVGSN